MAILQTLREKAGVFVAGAIGISLFIFVISDFFGNSNSQRRKQQACVHQRQVLRYAVVRSQGIQRW
jgi:hypothetical protein